MNLHALRVFAEVAARGSVTRAAEALLLSQPAVTAQVRKLEKETGLTLLSPLGRGIQLTEAGDLLFAYARRLFAWENELESRLRDFREGRIGTLRIVATNLAANLLLPRWMAAFKQAYPQVNVMLTTGNSRTAFDHLLHYQADIAVVAGGWEEPGVTRDILWEDELWFIVPRGHRLASQEVPLGELMKEPFLSREEGSSTRERLLSLCKAHNVEPPTIGLHFTGMNEAIRCVIAGYGAMLVPALAVSEHVQRGEVARVFVTGVEIRRPITVCRREEEELSPAASQFVQMIKQMVDG
jgi:DNA-binding transcriptional LysR family regulator